MLVNITKTGPLNAPTPTSAQSRALLDFLLKIGAERFMVNFVYVKGEKSEVLMNEFFTRILPFAAGKRVLENIEGTGFEDQDCWLFDPDSANVIIDETGGDLFAYDLPHLPEDWLFYAGDSILMQIVTHEQEATLRLTETQYAAFKMLGIPHALGCPQYSGLPESPVRSNGVR